MFITNHALAGAAVGALARRPVPAFLVGVASHLAMDMVLHYGDDLDWDDVVDLGRVDGTIGLAVTAALAATAPPSVRRAVLAGVAGACVVDMDKPGRHFLGRSPFPSAVDQFHGRIQRESPAGRWVEAAAAVALAAGVVAGYRLRG